MPVFWRKLEGVSGLEEFLTHSTVADEDQRYYVLPFKYLPGSHELSVYLNGVRQELGVDYEETSEQAVTFLKYVPLGARVVFVRDR